MKIANPAQFYVNIYDDGVYGLMASQDVYTDIDRAIEEAMELKTYRFTLSSDGAQDLTVHFDEFRNDIKETREHEAIESAMVRR